MQAQNLERTSSKSSSPDSVEHEQELPRHTRKGQELEEECKPMHGQSDGEVTHKSSTPNRAEKLAQAIHYDLPKEIMDALLPPLTTPQDYMAGQL